MASEAIGRAFDSRRARQIPRGVTLRAQMARSQFSIVKPGTRRVPQVVRDANGTRCDRLRSDERIHAPDLLAGLFEVAPNRECLPCRSLVEGQHSRTPQERVKPDILRPGRASPGKAHPHLYRSERGDVQRPAPGGGDTIFDVAMTVFLVEHCSDDAGVQKILHFLKIRPEIRGPNSHGPSFCISLNTRNKSRP